MAKDISLRIIVSSEDLFIKKRIVDGFNTLPFCEIFASPRELLQAVEYFDRSKVNVLILDRGRMEATEKYFNRLVESFNLMIILLYFPKFIIANSECIRISARPQPTSSSFFWESFLKDIREMLMPFYAKASKLLIRPTGRPQIQTVPPPLIIMASSTGGTEAVPVVLKDLPADCPPCVIVQHMPSNQTAQFAEMLNNVCAMNVAEAAGGEKLEKGLVLVARGDLHIRVIKRNMSFVVHCFEGPKVHGVRPSADVLLRSIGELSYPKIIGVTLTGAGTDGAKGLLELKQKGAKNIGQDEKTCVIYGMSKAAFEMGALDYQLPLQSIGRKINELVKQMS